MNGITWALVISPIVAALLGVLVGFVGTSYQQRKQTERDDQIRQWQAAHDARIRLEAGLAELLAAAQDVIIGVRAIRQAHLRRTKFRYYIRLLGTFWHAISLPTTWRDLVEYPTLKTVLGSALEPDREITESERLVVLDAASVLAPKLNRYFAVAALLTLGP
jgi:hypothetical protein